ncbi:hypothetical protein GCM10020331_069060 [Ectobacillus funiculus]
MQGLTGNPYVYYVHSFYADTANDVIVAGSDYGVFVPGVVSKGNIYGAQFHPEKKQRRWIKKMLQKL